MSRGRRKAPAARGRRGLGLIAGVPGQGLVGSGNGMSHHLLTRKPLAERPLLGALSYAGLVLDVELACGVPVEAGLPFGACGGFDWRGRSLWLD